MATPARLHATNPGRARSARSPECRQGPNRSPSAAWWEPNPFTGFAAAAPLALLATGDAAPSGESIVALLGLGLFSTAIAWPILFRLNREVGPMATSTVTFLNPVFGTLWGALFLAETISPTFLIGAFLVSASLMLIFELPLPTVLRRPAAAAVPAEADE